MRWIVRASIFVVRVFTVALGPMSLHRFGATHQASLRSLRTMMTYANSTAKVGPSTQSHLTVAAPHRLGLSAVYFPL
jgi:hypothetical protein